jgi:PPK2 family polyphosphate:nucleotide phosphotransferase
VLDALRIEPKKALRLADRDTASVPGHDIGKKDAAAGVDDAVQRLEVQQQRLFAEDERSLLVVIQGMDTSGKDGAIKNVFRGITPSATQIAAFKAPSTTELAHDYLWRVHMVCPQRGRIGIFNRSHYEDVIAARVRGDLPKKRVRQRYRHINEFERMLDDEGTTVVKVFLHLSKGEQRERLLARLAEPEKRWKFRVGDLDDRARWDDFQRAYEDAIAATSTTRAPWYVVPADKKWLRDAIVAEIVASTLERMAPRLPPDDPALADIEIT